MAGLSINYENGIFRYIFDESLSSEFKIIDGIENPNLLKRALKGKLPNEVRARIQRVLNV